MSDTPKPEVATFKEPLEYDESVSLGENIALALISIANSVAIIANETADMSPIVEAAFILAEGGPTEDGDCVACGEPLVKPKGGLSS